MTAPLINAQTVAIAPEAGAMPSAPGPFLHVAIFVPATGGGAANTILCDETFRLVSFEGQESTSELFEFQLELHANTDTGFTAPDYLGSTSAPAPPDIDLTMDDLIGLPITVGINCPCNLSAAEISRCFYNAVHGLSSSTDLSLLGDVGSDIIHAIQTDVLSGSPTQANPTPLAYFNGIITAVALAEQGVYHITMGPALAQLKHTNAYTIYCNQSILGAIETIIGTSSSFPTPVLMRTSIQTASNASLATARVQDWLQAGESHYDFITRLMNKANLYYYFVHDATSHTVVFADNSNLDYPALNTNIAAFRYAWGDATELGEGQDDVISNYRYQRNLASSCVSSSFTRQFANFEEDAPTSPSSYLASGSALTSQAVTLPLALYKNYDFGALHSEVRNYTDAANASLAANSVQFSGTAYCAQFRVGHQFQMANVASQYASDSPTTDNPLPNPTLFRPAFAGRNFVLTQIKHQASADGLYQNDFQATTTSGLITSFSPQQSQQEALLAIVVKTAPNWESFTPNYFDPVTASFSASDGSSYLPTGVNVVFAADPDGNTYFVKLSASMQTAPEAGAIVLISRAQNESELPEIQNVISACGSTSTTPTTWDANTRVGNNYGTNFGDSQNYTFGKNSLLRTSGGCYNTAVRIVSSQYLAGYYREAGYTQGASYSYGIAEGMAYASTVTSEVLAGELDNVAPASTLTAPGAIVLHPAAPALDTAAPSPIPATAALVVPPLQSDMTAAINTTGVSAPTVAAMTSAPLVTQDLLLSVSEAYGSTYAQSQANVNSNISSTGTSFNQSVTGKAINWATTTLDNTSISNNLGTNTSVGTNTGVSTNINTNLSDSISLNTTLGDSTDVNVVSGNVKSTTIQKGDVITIIEQKGNAKISTTTTQTGNIVNTTTQGGAVTNTTTVGGVATNTNSYLAAVFDTNSYVGALTTINTQLGLVSTMTTYGGIVNDVTNALSARMIYQNGAADVIKKAFAEKNKTETVAFSEETEACVEKIITHTYGSIELNEVMGSGMISRIRPGVTENIVSGIVNHVVEMMTIL